MSRLFLALWPDAKTRACLARQRSAWSWRQAPAWVRNDKLHLTLHFLGNVASARLPELAAGLAVEAAGFTLSFGRLALWPRGIAVLEPHAAPALPPLHAALADALSRLGLPVEARPLRPHVTLARHAEAARMIAAPEAFDWAVDHYALVESQLASGDYRLIARYPLLRNQRTIATA